MTFIFPELLFPVGICEFVQDRATTWCVEAILSSAKLACHGFRASDGQTGSNYWNQAFTRFDHWSM